MLVERVNHDQLDQDYLRQWADHLRPITPIGSTTMYSLPEDYRVESAKMPETRERRVESVLDLLMEQAN
jgi:hypothetical protein